VNRFTTHHTVALVILLATLTAGAVEDVAELERQAAAATGAEKIELLNKLAAAYNQRDPEAQIRVGRQALALASQADDRKGEARALLTIGCGHLARNESGEALETLTQSRDLYRGLQDLPGQINCIVNIGWVYENMGDFDQAMTQYRQALELARGHDLEKSEAQALQFIGIVDSYCARFDSALDSFLKALTIQQRLGDNVQVANLQSSIGTVYCELGEYERGLERFQAAFDFYEHEGLQANMAIALGNIGIAYENTDRPEQALAAYQKALGISEEIGDRMSVGRALGNMGGTYVDLERFEEALHSYELALEIWREAGNTDLIGYTLGNIGELYLRQKEWHKALEYLDESSQLLDEDNDPGQVMTNHLNRSIIYEALDRYREALAEYRQGMEVNESILSSEKQRTIAELEAKYEDEAKRRKIELLEKDLEIQQLQLSKTRFRLGAILAGLLLLVALCAILFHRYLHLLAFWKRKTYISHFKLERQIGSGGMGVVYAATDLTGKRSVALKVIREELAHDPAQRKRFLNEAYLVDKLDHPNIIKVYERGEYQQTLYIAMELLEGRSLADLIGEGTRLPLDDCLAVMRQLTEALTLIHRQGILHRDVKPENVMMVNGGSNGVTVKLLDFGLAQAPSLTRLTETGEILGTITYLSPEKITRQQLTSAGDIYALGVVFYELLTLEKPFWGDNPGEIVRAILDQEPLDPRRFRPQLPQQWSSLILRMLNKSPEDRPDGEELLSTLSGT
jgi:tetratricopeptide (TPR) repeat protein